MKISQTFSPYQRKTGRPRSITLPKEMEKQLKPFKDELERLHQEQEGLIDHVTKTSRQLSDQKTDIERGGSALLTTAAVQTRTIISGGGGSSSIVADKTRLVIKTVVADTPYSEVFEAPATFLSLPVVWAITDGMMSAQWVRIDSLTINGFTATPPISGEMYYAYKLL